MPYEHIDVGGEIRWLLDENGNLIHFEATEDGTVMFGSEDLDPELARILNI